MKEKEYEIIKEGKKMVKGERRGKGNIVMLKIEKDEKWQRMKI